MYGKKIMKIREDLDTKIKDLSNKMNCSEKELMAEVLYYAKFKDLCETKLGMSSDRFFKLLQNFYIDQPSEEKT